MIQRLFSLLITVLLATAGIPQALAGSGADPAPQKPQAFCDEVTQVPIQECEALEVLYNSTGGAAWTNQAGWLDTLTPCSWYGVFCTSGHVNTLNLGSNNLSGTLPPELDNLSFLDTLDFDDNHLSGSIPPELGNLSQLRVISLESNSLSGTIPTALGSLTQLQEIWMANNQITGAIPHEIGALSNLTTLDFRNNQLNLPLPAELGNLTSLADMLLQNNQINGSIPPELGNLNNLDSLALSNNQLSGSLPPELANISSLRYIVINNNHLAGSIPSEYGNLSNLVALNLICNRLSGSIPSSLGNLHAVTQMSLNGNQLEGDIPPALTQMTALAAPFLDLGYNRLTASDPAVLTWLDTHDPDWATTQTITPGGLHAVGYSANSVTLAWTPIAYTADGGYYEILQAEHAGGPYTVAGQTANKSTASITISDFPAGGSAAYAIRSYTPAHDFIMIGPGWNLFQQNPLYSALSPAVPVSITQVDPVNGGALEITDASGSQTQVTVPGGAVSETVTVSLAPDYPSPAPPVGFRFAGYAFELNASIGGVVQEGFTFNQPVTVTLNYTDEDVAGIDEYSLILYTWDQSAHQFVDAATSCAPASSYARQPEINRLTLPICHLSEFVLGGEPYRTLLPLITR